jgi:hypothetical protein
MFLARLLGNVVRLTEVTQTEVSQILFSGLSLSDGKDLDTILKDDGVMYWSVYDKTTEKLIGLTGVTKNLLPNLIFFKFVEVGEFEYKYIEDTLKLILDYLEYQKLFGIYRIKLKQTGHTFSQTLNRLGFTKIDENSWTVII